MIFSNRQLVPGVWHESHLVAPMEHVACFAFAAVVCGEEQRFNTDSSGVVREIMTNSGFFHSFFIAVQPLLKHMPEIMADLPFSPRIRSRPFV